MSVTPGPVGGQRPRKRFGQHFLHDPRVVSRILSALDPRPGEALVEIGPGRGVLTEPLLERCGRLEVVELDRDLAGALPRAPLAARGTLVVHQADALGFDFAGLARSRGQPLRLVGNLPYNISSPLLFHLLEATDAVRDMHFMLQREVVARLAARPGTADYGRLGVMVQYRCAVEWLFDVGPGAFAPPPKVESAFVRLAPLPAPRAHGADPGLFAQVVRQAFSARRKMLRNALAGLLDADALRRAGVDPQARPEDLSVEDFGRLAEQVAGG